MCGNIRAINVSSLLWEGGHMAWNALCRFSLQRHFVSTCWSHNFVNRWINVFLGALAKFRKTSVNLAISVCTSVCSHGTTRVSLDRFWSNLIFVYFSKCVEVIKMSLQSDKTVHEDQHTFVFILSHSVLLRMRNVSNKTCRGNQNTFYVQQLFFRKSCLLRDNEEKYCKSRTGHRWKHGAYAVHAGYQRLQIHIQNRPMQ